MPIDAVAEARAAFILEMLAYGKACQAAGMKQAGPAAMELFLEQGNLKQTVDGGPLRDAADAYAREVALALWGQEADTGHFVFVVRVRGLPAMSKHPADVARELCAMWNPALWLRFGPLCTVESAEDRRAAIERGELGGKPC